MCALIKLLSNDFMNCVNLSARANVLLSFVDDIDVSFMLVFFV